MKCKVNASNAAVTSNPKKEASLPRCYQKKAGEYALAIEALTMESTVHLFPVSELLGCHFFVPSYQRGYRWAQQQVEDLLNDIYAFAIKRNKNDKEFYCLQPIVVKPHTWLRPKPDGTAENVVGWELIDGQQRLTTLRILLSYLEKTYLNGVAFRKEYGKDLFTIAYETRADTEGFLNKLADVEGEIDAESLDFHYIAAAYRCIYNWFELAKNPRDARDSIIRTLVYDQPSQKAEGIVQVIWYAPENLQNPIDAFVRINMGKIPLTNAELIKALFLQTRSFGSTAQELGKQRQLELASEWDRIENALQDDDFWYFLNPAQCSPPNRIELLFDLLRETALRKDPALAKQIGTDQYATFRYFQQRLETSAGVALAAVKQQWQAVVDCFGLLTEWYHNPEWYHYVGFLVCAGVELVDLMVLCQSGVATKADATNALKKRIKQEFAGLQWEQNDRQEVGLKLRYSTKDRPQIRSLLLLYNVVTNGQHRNDTSRFYKFPFQLFKNEDWDIEHIDSSTANPLRDRKTRLEWLAMAEQDLPEIAQDAELANAVKRFKDNEQANDFATLEARIRGLAEEGEGDEDLKNTLGNLALLNAKHNRAYGNALFPTKRRCIIEWDKAGNFVPMGTKNAFLKYFDSTGMARSRWTEDDIRAYGASIYTALRAFLPPPPRPAAVAAKPASAAE